MAKVLTNMFGRGDSSSNFLTVLPIASTPTCGEKEISLQEVSWHDTAKDCWIVIYDRVYDVTSFLEEHPGGGEILLEYAGRDASLAFRGSGHSVQAVRALEKFLIGELPIHEKIFRKPGGLRLSDIPV